MSCGERAGGGGRTALTTYPTSPPPPGARVEAGGGDAGAAGGGGAGSAGSAGEGEPLELEVRSIYFPTPAKLEAPLSQQPAGVKIRVRLSRGRCELEPDAAGAVVVTPGDGELTVDFAPPRNDGGEPILGCVSFAVPFSGGGSPGEPILGRVSFSFPVSGGSSGKLILGRVGAPLAAVLLVRRPPGESATPPPSTWRQPV